MTQEQDLQEQQQPKTPKRPARGRKKTATSPTGQDASPETTMSAPLAEQNQPSTGPATPTGKEKTSTRRTRRPAAKAAKPAVEADLPVTDAAPAQAATKAAAETLADAPAAAPAAAPASGPISAPAGKPKGRASSASKRGRGKAPKKDKTAEALVFNPQAFTDVYPSLAPNLASGPGQLPEYEDGPQPALPNQPSLALPPSEEDEAFLRDLDERVNGNRLTQQDNLHQPNNRGKNNQRSKNSRSSKQRDQSRPKSPVAAAAPAPLAEQARQTPAKPEQTPDQSPGQTPEQRPEQSPEQNPEPNQNQQPKQQSKAQSGKQSDKQAGKQQKSGKASKSAVPAPEEKPQTIAKRILYVSVVPEEQVEVLITEDGQVVEYFIEMAHQAKIRGNIYKGVINNVDANLQAAFVNFGVGKNGFLQIDEVHPEYYLNYVETKGGKYPPIQKVLKNGQEVLVQVVKEPSGSKGAFLTTWISLAGRFLVLTPGQEQMGISRKVEEQQERNRLKDLLVGLKPGPNLGLILRTAGQDATKTSINKDLQYLKRLWKDILKKVGTESTPALIYQEADLASRAVRDYLNEDITEIWVDDAPTQAAIQETTNLLFPRKPNLVKLHQDPRQTLWERFNLQRQIEEITSREVVLPSGGRLVFDQTEALMAIDINSGKVQGKSNGFEDMVYKTNLEAAKAIARHLRLRDIGGQIVIDFIEMRDRNHVREVEKTLRNAMRPDRARHDIGHISSFGLLELVRQRIGSSGISISSEPCPHCHGTGVRRNLEWQALHALRDIQAKLRKMQDQAEKNKGKNGYTPAKALVYETETELGLYLLNHKRDRLLELESTMQTRIDIIPKA